MVVGTMICRWGCIPMGWEDLSKSISTVVSLRSRPDRCPRAALEQAGGTLFYRTNDPLMLIREDVRAVRVSASKIPAKPRLTAHRSSRPMIGLTANTRRRRRWPVATGAGPNPTHALEPVQRHNEKNSDVAARSLWFGTNFTIQRRTDASPSRPAAFFSKDQVFVHMLRSR